MTWRIHVEPFTRPLFFAWSRLTRETLTLNAGAAVVKPPLAQRTGRNLPAPTLGQR